MKITDTSDLWWKTAVIYCLDVETYLDADGDGVGDLRGLAQRIDYLAQVGVTCLWLMPFYPTPDRDDGYDISDFYGVDPRFGTHGDLVEVLRTHPTVLLDRTVIDNPHYVPPSEYPPTSSLSAAARYPMIKVGTDGQDGPDQGWASLTDAELRVVSCVVGGATNRSIAEELHLSRHTVDAHLKHVYLKLDIHSRVELAVLAMHHAST